MNRGGRLLWFGSVAVAHSLLLLAVMLVSCRPRPAWLDTSEPLEVQDLCPLSGDQMRLLDEDDVREWMKETYGCAAQDVRPLPGSPLTILGCSAWGMTVDADLYQGELVQLSIYGIDDGPSFGQIVAASGPPDVVYADEDSYEAVMYTIGLEYPERGVTVFSSGSASIHDVLRDGDFVLELTQEMPVDRIACYTPGTMEDVLRESYLFDEDAVKRYVESTVPWPGFGELVVLCPECQ